MITNSIFELNEGYRQLLQRVVDGADVFGRNGHTKEVTGCSFSYEPEAAWPNQLPIIHARKLHLKQVIGEWVAFMKGDCLTQAAMESYGCKYWKPWADEEGNLGPIYGAQWRSWGDHHHDQLEELINNLRTDPYSRRHILTCWNPEKLGAMALPPCYPMMQFLVDCSQGNYRLNLIVTQRSCDIIIGLPYDMILYSLMLQYMAAAANRELTVGKITVNFGSLHMYMKHEEAADFILNNSMYHTIDLKSSLVPYNIQCTIDAERPDDLTVSSVRVDGIAEELWLAGGPNVTVVE